MCFGRAPALQKSADRQGPLRVPNLGLARVQAREFDRAPSIPAGSRLGDDQTRTVSPFAGREKRLMTLLSKLPPEEARHSPQAPSPTSLRATRFARYGDQLLKPDRRPTHQEDVWNLEGVLTLRQWTPS
jgi:hypothetical protein